MIKLIKSMLYRATHDLFFYIAAGLCILCAVFLIATSDSSTANHMPSEYDKSVIVKYEEEDPLIAVKHLVFTSDTNFHNVPGHDVKYQDSIMNVFTSNCVVLFVSIVVFIICVLYGVYFFGDLFTKGGIRNMIAAGATKRQIFMSSIVVNAMLLIIFPAVSAFSMLIIAWIKHLYLIIYLPALCVYLLAEYLIGLVFSSLVILLVFITQRPLKAFLIVLGCAVFYCVFAGAAPLYSAFDMKYKVNSQAWQSFYKGAKEHDLGFEWYFPVNGFNTHTIMKADGTVYKDFLTDEPNPQYVGDTEVAISRVIWRLNIANIIEESAAFYMFPLYRDGVLLRYIAVSSVYLCIVVSAGCIVVKRRDII